MTAGLVVGATAVGAGVLVLGGPAGARSSGATGPEASAAPPAALRIELRRVAAGLDRPVAVVSAKDGTGRVFVAERQGRVRVVDRTGRLERAPFLDIAKKVGGVAPRAAAVLGDGAREGRGLLGLAFHPRFKTNGLFFVSYTDKQGDLLIARFAARGGGATPATTVDAATERLVLRVARPANARPRPGSGQKSKAVALRAADHNGGQLAFGPEGYLYIGVGDSGGVGDPAGSAQDRRSLRGKILRIAVDDKVGTPAQTGPGAKLPRPYTIPSTNPFTGVPAYRQEIWALGLRDPRGLSFDRRGGHLWVADAGHSLRQEVNRIGAGLGGRNLGWDCREGTVDVASRYGGSYCTARQFSGPVWNYRVLGARCAVVGGAVYRGTRFASQLGGRYLYADRCSGEVWALDKRSGNTYGSTLVGNRRGITAFGEDEAGELLVTTTDGGLHRLGVAGVATPVRPVAPTTVPTTTVVPTSTTSSMSFAPATGVSPVTTPSLATSPTVPAPAPVPAKVDSPAKAPAPPAGQVVPVPANRAAAPAG